MTDSIGSVTGLFDSSGTWAGGDSYGPFGEARSAGTNDAVVKNPFRYISGSTEGADLYKFGARYYDATTGRFA